MIFCVVVFGINFTVLRQFKLVSKEKFTKPMHCWLLRNAKGNKYGTMEQCLQCLNYLDMLKLRTLCALFPVKAGFLGLPFLLFS